MKFKLLIGIIIVIIIGVVGTTLKSKTDGDTSSKNDAFEQEGTVPKEKDPDKITPIDTLQVPERGYFLGVLPIPYEGQDLDDIYKLASETCEIVPVWGCPSPYWEKAANLEGQWGNFYVEELIRGNEMTPLLHFSFIGENLTLSMPKNTDYTLGDKQLRQEYKKAVLESVKICRPVYLSLGNEVNRWYEKYGMEGENGFYHWISLYEEIYDEVKILSPRPKYSVLLVER